jgi:transcriptional regulator with XRE-family HTH domain
LDEFSGRGETFASRLQKAMGMRGMKKVELARLTGMSQQRIGQYVHGLYEARQSAVFVIAKALGVDPAWLAGYDVPMEPKPCCDSKSPKKGRSKIADEDLKLALFGDREVNDDVLEDVKDMAKIHLELLKKKRCARQTA